MTFVKSLYVYKIRLRKVGKKVEGNKQITGIINYWRSVRFKVPYLREVRCTLSSWWSFEDEIKVSGFNHIYYFINQIFGDFETPVNTMSLSVIYYPLLPLKIFNLGVKFEYRIKVKDSKIFSNLSTSYKISSKTTCKVIEFNHSVRRN